MLTVKHIRADGAETIDHADRVIYYPPHNYVTNELSPTPHEGGTLTVVGAISGGVDWMSGTVYVMNENGSTVAKYLLGNRSNAEDALGTPISA
jgi:hypothetical protein